MTHCGKKIITEQYRRNKRVKEHYAGRHMKQTSSMSESGNEIDTLKKEIHTLRKALDKFCGPGRHFHHEHHLSDEHGCMNDSDM